jgi:CRISPR/Cas system-associated protein endoribonuclease Cas2
VIGRTITCENHREFNQKLEFHYDYVFSNQHEFAKSAYNCNLQPLVRDALRGESNMIIFGGVQSMNMNRFLLSQTVMQGLISQAAGQLLNAVNLTEEKMGSVTFSWYKLDCGSPEIITDVLKAASTQSAANQMGNSFRSSNDNNSSSTNTGLILREAGKSRGMYVPGLWEVEIANGAEIETVITHVLDAIPQIADHSIGTSHTIMQLSVVNKLASQQQQQPLSPGSLQEEQPATGKITFLLLSNLSPADQQYLASNSNVNNNNPNNTNNPSANPALSSPQWFPWVEQLFSILQWLESRRASPPFHKSRLLLILREVLLRRQRASLMLIVHPSADQHVVNIQWQKLFAFLSKDLAPTVVSFINNNKPLISVKSAISDHQMKRTPSAQRMIRSDSNISLSNNNNNIPNNSSNKRAISTPSSSRSSSLKRGTVSLSIHPNNHSNSEGQQSASSTSEGVVMGPESGSYMEDFSNKEVN